jgi:hypothetical protein
LPAEPIESVKTFKEQQRKQGVGPYRFQRVTNRPTDTAAGDGYGQLAKPNGLICSVFRPSDDGTVFPYLIPSNFFAVKSLRQLTEMVTALYYQHTFAAECAALADEVHAALKEHAVVEHKKFGRMLAYENERHHAGPDLESGRGHPKQPENAQGHACGHGLHARVFLQGRRRPVHPQVVCLGQHALRRIHRENSQREPPPVEQNGVVARGAGASRMRVPMRQG